MKNKHNNDGYFLQINLLTETSRITDLSPDRRALVAERAFRLRIWDTYMTVSTVIQAWILPTGPPFRLPLLTNSRYCESKLWKENCRSGSSCSTHTRAPVWSSNFMSAIAKSYWACNTATCVRWEEAILLEYRGSASRYSGREVRLGLRNDKQQFLSNLRDRTPEPVGFPAWENKLLAFYCAYAVLHLRLFSEPVRMTSSSGVSGRRFWQCARSHHFRQRRHSGNCPSHLREVRTARPHRCATWQVAPRDSHNLIGSWKQIREAWIRDKRSRGFPSKKIPKSDRDLTVPVDRARFSQFR